MSKPSSSPPGDAKSPRRAGRPTGPTSIEGVEASDLPDGGRGSVETNHGRELRRHTPQSTGEVVGSDINTDVGLTGHPEVREADEKSMQPARHQGDK